VEKMTKKSILILGIVALILISFSLATAQKSAVMPQREATPIPADKLVPITPPVGEKDQCYLYYTNWTPASYYSGWYPGDKVAIYFDPMDCGYPQNYPFQLTDVEFMLYDFAAVGTINVRFSVEQAYADSCLGPGPDIYLSPVYTITTFYPDIVHIDFPLDSAICLYEPFFFNLEYMSGQNGFIPSVLFDNHTPVDTCFQWVWYDGYSPPWWEWYNFWADPYNTGWALLGISALCGPEQTDCEEECDPNDLGICDTLYVETFDCDHNYQAEPGSFDSVRVAIYVTHDSNTFWWEEGLRWVQDSIRAFVVPLTFWHQPPGCADSVILPNWGGWNNNCVNPSSDSINRSIFRNIVDAHTGDTVYNRMLNLKWAFRYISIESHSCDGDSGHARLSMISSDPTNRLWWEGSRVLLATLTFLVYKSDTCECTEIGIDSTFWPPSNRLAFNRYDAVNYIPRHFLPVKDTICLSESLYWKPPYEDYAPSGMPDISQMQAIWVKDPTGEHTFCGPCAVANCFQWFDSKYNQATPGIPGDGMDMFPLVRDYLDALPPLVLPFQDDHDPNNMDHPATPWLFGGTLAPPGTPQPFIPGFQNPPQPMIPWGELVERLAYYFNTDGVKTGYCQHNGTEVHDMYQGIQNWFNSEHFANGSTLSDTLCVNLWQKPTFALVESLIEKCEDVVLLLGFWWPDTSGQWYRCGGHYVTVAGINSQDFLIAVSDPMFDWAEMGNPGRVLNGQYIPHTPGHAQTAHNDVGNVSHDLYHVIHDPISPGGLWELADYVVSQRPWYCDDLSLQNIPTEFQGVSAPWPGGDTPVFTEVEYAIQISPWDYRGDVNHDGKINSADVVYLINYLFAHGSPPVPLSDGDVNCDGNINSADVVYLINYLFAHGSAPCRVCDP
jgi:hypothetical protein